VERHLELLQGELLRRNCGTTFVNSAGRVADREL